MPRGRKSLKSELERTIAAAPVEEVIEAVENFAYDQKNPRVREELIHGLHRVHRLKSRGQLAAQKSPPAEPEPAEAVAT